MREVTKYRISGVTNYEPTDLPEGVTAVPFKDKLIKEAHINTVFGSFKVVDSVTTKNAVTISGLGVIPQDEVRKLRDFLNEVLEESGPTLRRVWDNDNSATWAWYEVSEDRFIWATSREDANRTVSGSDYSGVSFETIQRDCGIRKVEFA